MIGRIRGLASSHEPFGGLADRPVKIVVVSCSRSGEFVRMVQKDSEVEKAEVNVCVAGHQHGAELVIRSCSSSHLLLPTTIITFIIILNDK